MNHSDRFLHFQLHEDHFAIPLLSVREVLAMPELTSVPKTPSYFLGIMNLRGQILSVLDLRKKMELPTERGPETTVILCEVAGLQLGVVVDCIHAVETIAQEKIMAPPEHQAVKHNGFVSGIYQGESRLLLILDLAKALNLQENGTAELIRGQSQLKAA